MAVRSTRLCCCLAFALSHPRLAGHSRPHLHPWLASHSHPQQCWTVLCWRLFELLRLQACTWFGWLLQSGHGRSDGMRLPHVDPSPNAKAVQARRGRRFNLRRGFIASSFCPLTNEETHAQSPAFAFTRGWRSGMFARSGCRREGPPGTVTSCLLRQIRK